MRWLTEQRYSPLSTVFVSSKDVWGKNKGYCLSSVFSHVHLSMRKIRIEFLFKKLFLRTFAAIHAKNSPLSSTAASVKYDRAVGLLSCIYVQYYGLPKSIWKIILMIFHIDHLMMAIKKAVGYYGVVTFFFKDHQCLLKENFLFTHRWSVLSSVSGLIEYPWPEVLLLEVSALPLAASIWTFLVWSEISSILCFLYLQQTSSPWRKVSLFCLVR